MATSFELDVVLSEQPLGFEGASNESNPAEFIRNEQKRLTDFLFRERRKTGQASKCRTADIEQVLIIDGFG